MPIKGERVTNVSGPVRGHLQDVSGRLLVGNAPHLVGHLLRDDLMTGIVITNAIVYARPQLKVKVAPDFLIVPRRRL